MSNSSDSATRLSVAIIAKDAAQTIGDTLASIQSIADEIVVVDTGSTDETMTITSQFPVTLIKHPWGDDFSDARNHCLSHTTGDWILWLDAGETLSEDMANQLRAHIDADADPAKAYMLLVHVPQSATNIAGEQIGRMRLIPNHPKVRFAGRVREDVNESLADQDITIEGAPMTIQRTHREHDQRVKSSRANRNLRLAELEINETSRQPHLLVTLADAWQDLDDRGRATELYREAISTAERGSTELLEAYYGLLTSLESNDGDESQLRVCLSALEVFPLDGQLLCALGGYLQAMGRWDLATRSYETAFRYGQVNPETWHLDDLRAISAVCYNLALQLQNKDDEACAILNQALDGQPRSSRLLRALIDLHIKNKRESEALQHVEQLPLDAANRQQWSDVVRGAIHASRQEFNRARPYLQTAFDMGCREIICLRWLAVTLLAHEDQESASKVLDVWQAIDPTNQELASYRKLIVPDRPPTDPSKRVRIDDAVSMPAAPATLQPLNPATSPISSD